MTTRMEDAPLVTDGGSGEDAELDHWFCECSPHITFCGTKVTDPSGVFEEASCVVCHDLADVPCRRCGE